MEYNIRIRAKSSMITISVDIVILHIIRQFQHQGEFERISLLTLIIISLISAGFGIKHSTSNDGNCSLNTS